MEKAWVLGAVRVVELLLMPYFKILDRIPLEDAVVSVVC